MADDKVKVEVLHPIWHDGVQYSRGVHELDAETAATFLAARDDKTKRPIARKHLGAEAAAGVQTLTPEAERALEKQQAEAAKNKAAREQAEADAPKASKVKK